MAHVPTISLARPYHALINVLSGIGQFSTFSGHAMALAARPPWRMRLIYDQAYQLGLMAMPVASLCGIFVGMVIVLQTGYQLAAFNVKSFAAGGAAKALTQEMIPVFVAFVVGARAAASIAAELGTMRVTEQIDAMEILDVSPRRYLVVPRVIATTLLLPIITIYVDLLGLMGGMVIGVFTLGIPARQYITVTQEFLTFTDINIGLFKTVFFGLAIGLNGCFFGFNARGGAEGVGQATTKAVVFTLTWLILLEFILSSWTLYVVDNFLGGNSL